MIELREGDSLPVVATCQVLLNAYRLISTRIAIDGIFGRYTRDATKVLQQQNKLKATGRIDGETWSVLARGNRLSFYDSVDIFDPNMNTTVAAHSAGVPRHPTGQRAGPRAGGPSRWSGVSRHPGNDTKSWDVSSQWRSVTGRRRSGPARPGR